MKCANNFRRRSNLVYCDFMSKNELMRALSLIYNMLYSARIVSTLG